MLIEEKGNKEIAQALGLSLNTIKSYLKIIMRKLGVSSRAGVISCLLRKNDSKLSIYLCGDVIFLDVICKNNPMAVIF